MFSQIAINYPWWYVAVCLAAGIIYAVGLYFHDRSFTDPGSGLRRAIWLFALMRFLTVSTIAFLLLSPLLRYTSTETEKPLILVVEDNSSSISMSLDSQDLATYQSQLQIQLDRLAGDYEVQRFHYGLEFNNGPATNFDEQTTNLSAGLEGLYNLFVNRNTGAIIISGDGLYNSGKRPDNLAKLLNAPVYSIALGDTSQRKDMRLDRVLHNHLVYLGDRFSLLIDAGATKLKGSTTRLVVELVEQNNTKQVYSQTVNITDAPWNSTLECSLQANKAGMQHYRVSLVPLESELTAENNYADVFVEVLDAKRKLLLLADAPHPDLSAIKQSLQSKSNYQVDLSMASDFGGNIKDYSLVILHNLPSKRAAVNTLITEAKNQQIPLLFILGNATDLTLFNRTQDLLKISGGRGTFNNVQPAVNSNFKFFKVPETLTENMADYPPLQAPFGDYIVSAGGEPLLYQRIGAVKTDMPLLIYGQPGQSRTAVLCAEGIWKWRLYNYRVENNHDLIDELLSKSIQYLAVKTDQRVFRVTMDKRVYNENEHVKFQAELYNASYEAVNEADVNMTITDEQGREYNYLFKRTQAYYRLDAGAFPPGNYSYSAVSHYNDETHSQNGIFVVKALRLEALQTRADFGLMNELSASTGGALFFKQTIENLADSIMISSNAKPVLHLSTSNRSLINLKLLFFLLSGMLILEWFLRKRNGAY